jgi:threonine/homoserine/homoserine lactone efflux protein
MATETVVAAISLIALSSLHLSESIFRIISLVGAAILIWLATPIWKIHKIDSNQRVHFGTWKIVAMILANGALWIFWLTVCVPKAILLAQQVKYGDILFLVCVEVGWLISTASIAFIFSRFRGWLSKPKVVPVIFKVFAIAFIYFSLTSIYQSLLFFLRR